MIKLIIILVLSMTEPPKLNSPTTQHCLDVENVAKKIMQGRQAALPKSLFKQITDEPIVDILVKSAYDVPMYDSEELQIVAINAFGLAWYEGCMSVKK